MTPLLLLLALATSMPTPDIQNICRDVRSLALPEDQAHAYEGCLRDEQAAREQLQQKWTKFPADARASCTLELKGLPPSYVEMLTCLEMETGGFLGPVKPPQGPAGPSPSTPIQPKAPNAAGRP